MEKLKTIEELMEKVKYAKTYTIEGRGTIVRACKDLYNMMEEDVCKVGSEWMLPGLYKDLREANFAEPYMCELQKGTFATIVEIYKQRIIPRL